MSNVVVVGSQWGDEGKGKIVDWLSSRADVVVRFQGGHNAGHTLVIDGTVFKLALLPSGVVRGGKLSLIGNGVVIDPAALLREIAAIKEQGVGVGPDSLQIADNATLILPVHAAVDKAREAARGSAKIGTTGRGIGPAYEDKVGRRAIRVCDLRHPLELKEKVAQLLNYHNATLRGFGLAEFDVAHVLRELLDIAPSILPYAAPVWRTLHAAQKDKKTILFEGAQGSLLDVDHGTYPFVTSSNTVAAQAATGSGMGPQSLHYILGITKAYTTRVGSGPFPSEQNNDIGETLGTRGKEFGTNTGRKRRCGWFDAALVRQSVMLSGITAMALTKMDVMDTLPEIKICTGYNLKGVVLDYLPASTEDQAAVQPIYETMPGWLQSTQGIRDWNKLPDAAVKYIRRLEELVGIPVHLLSTSPERDDTILIHDPFAS